MPADRSYHPLPQNPSSVATGSGFGSDSQQPYTTYNEEIPIGDSDTASFYNDRKNERVQRVKPCRTLFVRNIAYDLNPDIVRTPFEQFGELERYYDLVARRGMCFVTYYDVRSAETAFNSMQGAVIGERPVDVHYSLPRADETSQPCDRDKHQGTISVWLESSTEPIDDSSLIAEFERFGEIKEFRSYDDRDDSRVIEYFDSRSASAAFDGLNGKAWNEGVLNLYFEWDCPMVSAPKKSGGYASKMGVERASTSTEPGAKAHMRRSRRGGRNRWKHKQNRDGTEDPSTSAAVNNAAAAIAAVTATGFGQKQKSDNNVRNAYSNSGCHLLTRTFLTGAQGKNTRHAHPQHQQTPTYGLYPPSAPQQGPPTPHNAHTADSARLAEAQRVQALLSSLNPSTLNMNAGGMSMGGIPTHAHAHTPAAMPIPTAAPAPAHVPVMATPTPQPQPQPQAHTHAQPYMQPYYASQSPPLSLHPQPVHTPAPAPVQSTLPPNVMSILQAASSNVSGAGGGGGGYSGVPHMGMGYAGAPSPAPNVGGAPPQHHPQPPPPPQQQQQQHQHQHHHAYAYQPNQGMHMQAVPNMQQGMHGSMHNNMQSVSVPAMSRDPRRSMHTQAQAQGYQPQAQAEQAPPQPPPQPQPQVASTDAPNPQSVQALLSMLNNP
ncbi:hypothetical protein E3P99_01713 [Wallemia hederae]|uniref:RRM domain-containing protein n=1 Tax=Wallemia hederae TaxID=1540922 RepID=A0A4T0FP31_9BASI|nr:hypothetical protein E3P99_01713 [Wallemia hederae]